MKLGYWNNANWWPQLLQIPTRQYDQSMAFINHYRSPIMVMYCYKGYGWMHCNRVLIIHVTFMWLKGILNLPTSQQSLVILIYHFSVTCTELCFSHFPTEQSSDKTLFYSSHHSPTFNASLCFLFNMSLSSISVLLFLSNTASFPITVSFSLHTSWYSLDVFGNRVYKIHHH